VFTFFRCLILRGHKHSCAPPLPPPLPPLQAAKYSVLAGPAPAFSSTEVEQQRELLHSDTYWHCIAPNKTEQENTGNEATIPVQ
jgi:hypothetical protein